MKVVFKDGTWVLGVRNRRAMGLFRNHESTCTHHMFVVDGSEEFKTLINCEIAIPYTGGLVKYFVLNWKNNE